MLGKLLLDKGYFPISSVTDLATVLDLTIEDLEKVSLKRIRAKNGERRSNDEFIYHPSAELKTILKRIDQRLLREIVFPGAFYSIGGKGQVPAAINHNRRDFLLKVDIKKFFYSIRARKVKQIFSDLLGCPTAVADMLTRLTTFDDIVPPGFPTSPRLAALAFLPTERGLSRLCAVYKLNLSIYADDLSISANWDFATQLEPKIKSLIKKGGFKIKTEKTTYRTANQSKEIVGIKIGTKANVPDRVVSEAKKIIRKFQKGAFVSLPIQDQLDNLERLRGLVNYINQINPLRGEKMRLQVGEIASKLSVHSAPSVLPNVV